ncbi:LFG5 [Symbiodinium natans]|uniref:LFG5 protein n=1 Tax=Symbiodinium natans TaxID=878477 RepID=A0A812MRB4_9DINO|nr:LFG5 [Symbiodinium natans]
MASFAPFDMEAQGRYPDFQGIGEKQMRLGFIRKVYGIVACQVAATALTAALCAGPLRPTIVGFVVHWPSAFKWGSLLATGLALFICYAGKNSYPLNFFGLAFLTAVMSLDVGVMAAVASAMGMGALVAQAAIITALLVTGLTIYTFRSKRDFSFLGAALWPLTFGLFAFGLLSCFFPSLHTGILGLIVSFAGAAIFCAYLVYDTWRIANELQVDDYVEGAIQLYMDIINLFMYILDILMQLNKGQNE